MSTITSLMKTQVAGVAWYTPFEVIYDLSDVVDLKDYKLIWIAEDAAYDPATHTAGNVITEVTWPRGNSLDLSATSNTDAIRYFTISATDATALGKPVFFRAYVEDNLAGTLISTASLKVDFKNIADTQPLVGSGDSVLAGGDISLATQVLTLSTLVTDTVGNPVKGMQVSFDFADTELDPQTTQTQFYIGTVSQNYVPPVVLTDAEGIATINVTCDSTHYLGFRSTVLGGSDDVHFCAFVNIGDGIPVNSAPVMAIEDSEYQIGDGQFLFRASVYPKNTPTTSDTVFLVANNRFIPPVIAGTDFTNDFYVPLAYLNLDEKKTSNSLAYYVQNNDGVVTASRTLSFGVKGNYENKPDPSITNRPMAAPVLKPALPAGKTITYDYLFLDPTHPGITVTIPGLPPGSPYINQDITLRFYLNGFVYDSYTALTNLVMNTALKGKGTAQDITLPVSSAVGYASNPDGVKKDFYAEYFYTSGSTATYSAYIKYPLNTSKP